MYVSKLYFVQYVVTEYHRDNNRLFDFHRIQVKVEIHPLGQAWQDNLGLT